MMPEVKHRLKTRVYIYIYTTRLETNFWLGKGGKKGRYSIRQKVSFHISKTIVVYTLRDSLPKPNKPRLDLEKTLYL